MVVKTLEECQFDGSSVANEFLALKKLRHPNIIAAHEFSPPSGDRGRDLVVMEYVRGMELRDCMEKGYYRVFSNLFFVLEGIASGLAHIHDNQMVHADLKPNNIIVDMAMTPRIIDFGLATLLSSPEGGKAPKPRSTSASVVPEPGGTLKYMAPERHQGLMSPASDIYAIGLIMFELFNNFLPLMNLPHTLFPFGPPDLTKPTMDALEAIYRKATFADASMRYQTGASFLDELTIVARLYCKDLDDGVYRTTDDRDPDQFNIGRVDSLAELAQALSRRLRGLDPSHNWFRIDGVPEADHKESGGNAESYAVFPLEIGGELLEFQISGDTRISALREFIRLCKKHMRYGFIEAEEFLIVDNLPDGNRALRLRINLDAETGKYRARGFYCYTTDSDV